MTDSNVKIQSTAKFGKGRNGLRTRRIYSNIVLIMLGSLLILTTVYGTRLSPTEMNLSQHLQPPSATHLFGTDHLGRDILARVAHGFFWDFTLCLSVVLTSVAIGVVLGLLAGYFGGITDNALVIIMDLIVSVPHIVIAMVIMIYLSYGPQALFIALIIGGWVNYARITRALTYSIKEEDFVVYERLIGAGPLLILAKHIFPHVAGPVLSLGVLHLGHCLLSIAALGFIGLGLQPPTPEWGTMVMEARPYIITAPWTALFPGLIIFLFIMFFTLLGYRLQNIISISAEVKNVTS